MVIVTTDSLPWPHTEPDHDHTLNSDLDHTLSPGTGPRMSANSTHSLRPDEVYIQNQDMAIPPLVNQRVAVGLLRQA